VKPLIEIARARTADGKDLSLLRRQQDYFIRVGAADLMTSRSHGSEEQLAELAWRALGPQHRKAPRVLVGGLDMGYTLRAALDRLPPRGSDNRGGGLRGGGGMEPPPSGSAG
jgi:hypothetical protein